MANKNYYLSPQAVSITPNSYNNLPDHIVVAIVNGTKIRLAASWQTDINGNNVNIGYTANLDYRTWTLTGGQYHLPSSVSNKVVNIYIRLERNGASGDIAISDLDVDIIGQYKSSDDSTFEVADNNKFYFVKLATLSAPNSNNLREITLLDTGELDSAQGRDNKNSGDLDQMFQNNPSYITLLKPLFRFFLFNSGQSSYIDRIITSVSNFTDWANEHGLATTASTAAYITSTLATFGETLNLKFFRKDQSDSTPYLAVFGDAQVKKDLTKSDSTKSTGNLAVDGKITGAEAQISGAITGASSTISGKTKTTTLESTNGSQLLGTTKFSASVEDGKSGGAITHPKNDNDAKLQVEYLHVLKKATFESLEVNHVEHIAGNLIMSPAKATLFDVVNMNDCYRCYFLASDGDGNTINNTWKAGDQAYCCTFDATALADVDEDGKHTDTKVGNRYYWRLVKAVSSQTVTRNGKTCHYIDLWNTSDTTKVDTSSDTPWANDYVVVRGNRTDTSRQGTIELNTTGAESNLPSFRIYNGINSFTMPTSKIDMNPHNVKMLVDELKIVTGGENKTIQKYIEEDTEHFNIFETESTAVPTLTNEPYISWTDAERTKYSTSPNNAVVLNSDGRTWKFTTNTSGAYTFEEFTDPWLLSQHQKVSDILDDACITADEYTRLKETAKSVLAFWEQAEEDYSNFDSPSSNLTSKLDALSEAHGNYYDDFISYAERDDSYPPPLYLNGYTGTKESGHYTFSFSRDTAISYATAYEKAVLAWNSALASEKQSKVGETAAAEAKEYVDDYITKNISTIVGDGLDNHIKDVVIPAWYETGTPSVKGRIESNESELTTVKESYEKTKAVVNGMVATTNSMFAGTSQTNFIQDSVDVNGTKVLLYQIKKQATNSDGQRLYWKTDADGNRYQTTEVTTEAVAVGDYSKEPVKATDSAYIANPANYLPRMVVANTDQSGLVTKSGFAAVFAQEVDADGNLSAIAQMGVYVKHVGVNTLPLDITSVGTSGKRWYSSSTDKYYYLSETDEDKTKGTYYYVESTAGISADKVSITSGNRNSSLGNYWSIDENGNAILGNVYAKDVTVSGVLLNLITEIKAGDSRLIRHGDYDDIDILRCGDVIKIKSANGKQLRLPYYISSSYNNRTYTKFNSTEAHLITPDELKTILGKRITLIIENSLPVEQTIDGIKWLHKPNSGVLLTDTSNEVNNLMFGERVFLLPTEDSQAGNMGLYQGIYNLEFKACLFKDGSGNLHNGFAWLLKNDARTCSIDTDENWGYVAPTTDES